jgi:ribosomal protein S18 acetylase RimI-like enzyme
MKVVRRSTGCSPRNRSPPANFWLRWKPIRRGAYRALYAHLLELAKAREDVCGLRLYVERENTNAIRTYEFLGMTDSGYRLYEVDMRED